jgi:hypothetical protein
MPLLYIVVQIAGFIFQAALAGFGFVLGALGAVKVSERFTK